MVENKMDSKIKCLRSNNGGEFTQRNLWICATSMEEKEIICF
jgi:hypothetical protein